MASRWHRALSQPEHALLPMIGALAPWVLAIALIVYSNGLSILCALQRRESWIWYTLGNALIGLIAIIWTWRATALRDIWGMGAVDTALGSGVILGVGLALPIVLLVILPTALGRAARQAGIGQAKDNRQLIFRIVIQALVTTVLFEEFMFRGILWELWRHVDGWPQTTVFESGAFALWHIALLWAMLSDRTGRQRVGLTLLGMFAFGLLGAVLGVIRHRTNSLLTPIAAHATLDIVMLVAMAIAQSRGRTNE